MKSPSIDNFFHIWNNARRSWYVIWKTQFSLQNRNSYHSATEWISLILPHYFVLADCSNWVILCSARSATTQIISQWTIAVWLFTSLGDRPLYSKCTLLIDLQTEKKINMVDCVSFSLQIVQRDSRSIQIKWLWDGKRVWNRVLLLVRYSNRNQNIHYIYLLPYSVSPYKAPAPGQVIC